MTVWSTYERVCACTRAHVCVCGASINIEAWLHGARVRLKPVRLLVSRNKRNFHTLLVPLLSFALFLFFFLLYILFFFFLGGRKDQGLGGCFQSHPPGWALCRPCALSWSWACSRDLRCALRPWIELRSAGRPCTPAPWHGSRGRSGWISTGTATTCWVLRGCDASTATSESAFTFRCYRTAE